MELHGGIDDDLADFVFGHGCRMFRKQRISRAKTRRRKA
jgi:hypothetical protein